MTTFAVQSVPDNSQKRSIRGTARALQGAISIAKDATANAARHDATRGRLPIGTAAAAGRLIEVLSSRTARRQCGGIENRHAIPCSLLSDCFNMLFVVMCLMMGVPTRSSYACFSWCP